MSEFEGRKSGLEVEREDLQKQLAALKNESQLGEELMRRQVQELKQERDVLRDKYDTETLIRKRLHNIIEDMKGKIRVFCRVRPMNEHELEIGSLPVVTITDQYTLKIKLKKEGASGPSTRDSAYEEKVCSFDACFGEASSQEEIFEDTKMLMQSAIDGFNVCVFAYGQTGSGKTHTIQGAPERPGIVPRALQELFMLKQKYEQNQGFTISFECYIVELYLEKLHDLLYAPETAQSEKPRLELFEDPHSGMININNV